MVHPAQRRLKPRVRFLREFASRVYHVHAKDTEINADNLYEFGSEQPATFTPSTPYGAWAWRYTLPGHEITRWSETFKILAATGYRGIVEHRARRRPLQRECREQKARLDQVPRIFGRLLS
jgi:sugar phosphate isomerase/epimerase